MTIKTLFMPPSVREGFIAYAEPLFSDPKYDPYKSESFPQIRYALERRMWQLLKMAPERDQAQAIMDEINTIKAGKCDAGFVIKGLPIDKNLPDTPETREAYTARDKGTVSELAVMAIISLMDLAPQSIVGLAGGQLIQQTIPQKGHEENTSSSRGSRVTFKAHTDSSYFTTPPRVFSLVCLKNTEGARTDLMMVDDILRQFDPQELQTMQRPIFTFPSTGTMDYGHEYTTTAPILTHENGVPRLRFNTADGRMISSTEEGRAMIERLNTLTDFEVSPVQNKGVILEPGDGLFLDNGRFAHGRSAFVPHQDPTKRRWLQRVLAWPTTREERFPDM